MTFMNYPHIAQLGRAAAMEKTGQRWLNKLMGKSSPKPYVPKSPLTSKPGTLRPELKNLANRYGIPEDEYLNIMRGQWQHSPLPGVQRAGLNVTPKQIQSALGGAAATAGAVSAGALLPTSDAGKESTSVGKGKPKQDKVLPHQATPVPD